MNILYTLNSSNIGGMELHVLDLVKGMKKCGHHVFVICPNGPLTARFENAGANVYKIQITKDIDFSYIKQTSKIIRDSGIDIVHSHELKASVNTLIAAFLSGLKNRVTHTHTPISEWQINNFKKRIDIFVYTFFVNLFSTYEIALTESRKKVKASEGIKPNKLKVIANGIDVEKYKIDDFTKSSYKTENFARFGFPKGSYVFGTLGRISREKGHFVLLKGFLEFKQKYQPNQNIKLLICGDGEMVEDLKTFINDNKMNSDVFITGRFDDEQKMRLLSTMDAFVHPSLAEGFGIVLIEAIAFGLPIVVSDLEVFKEVAGANATYFKTGDSSDLADKLNIMYEKRDNLGNILNFSRDRINALYSLNDFVDNYNKFYEEVIKI